MTQPLVWAKFLFPIQTIIISKLSPASEFQSGVLRELLHTRYNFRWRDLSWWRHSPSLRLLISIGLRGFLLRTLRFFSLRKNKKTKTKIQCLERIIRSLKSFTQCPPQETEQVTDPTVYFVFVWDINQSVFLLACVKFSRLTPLKRSEEANEKHAEYIVAFLLVDNALDH